MWLVQISVISCNLHQSYEGLVSFIHSSWCNLISFIHLSGDVTYKNLSLIYNNHYVIAFWTNNSTYAKKKGSFLLDLAFKYSILLRLLSSTKIIHAYLKRFIIKNMHRMIDCKVQITRVRIRTELRVQSIKCITKRLINNNKKILIFVLLNHHLN